MKISLYHALEGAASNGAKASELTFFLNKLLQKKVDSVTVTEIEVIKRLGKGGDGKSAAT